MTLISSSHKTTSRETVILILKANLGAGCLALPYSCSLLGAQQCVIPVLLISCITIYNMNLVVSCKHKINAHLEMNKNKNKNINSSNSNNNTKSKPINTSTTNTITDSTNNSSNSNSNTNNHLTYGDIAAHAFGPRGKKIIDFFLLFLQLSICTVFISFVSNNILSLFPSHQTLTYLRIIMAL